MRYIIVTCMSLVWFCCSLMVTFVMLMALLDPSWLVGPAKLGKEGNNTVTYTPSVGVYTRCKPTTFGENSCTTLAVRGLATDSNIFPNFWKASTVLIALGTIIMFLSAMGVVMSCCIQKMFIITGIAQVFSGMCFIIAIMIYPMDWYSPRVLALCGNNASPFYPGECSIGRGFYYAIGGMVGTLLSASMSAPASRCRNSDKVQDKINEGHSFVCIV